MTYLKVRMQKEIDINKIGSRGVNRVIYHRREAINLQWIKKAAR